jgi:hypothetical protein
MPGPAVRGRVIGPVPPPLRPNCFGGNGPQRPFRYLTGPSLRDPANAFIHHPAAWPAQAGEVSTDLGPQDRIRRRAAQRDKSQAPGSRRQAELGTAQAVR